MKYIVDFHINMKTALESSEEMVEPTLKLWLLTGLKMPPQMVKALSIEKITRVDDMPEVLSDTLQSNSKPFNGESSIIPQPVVKRLRKERSDKGKIRGKRN
jgi:hypothetical protein